MLKRLAAVVQTVRRRLTGPRPPDPFLEMCAAFARRLQRWPLRDLPAPAGESVGVLVTPWMDTAVPMLGLECATMLRRAGRPVTLILDVADVVGNSPNPVHEAALRELCASLSEVMPTVETLSASQVPADGDNVIAERLAQANAVRITWGESTAYQFFEQHPQARARLQEHLARVRGLLAQHRFHSLLVPGGIYGLSGLYLAAARELGLRCATWDGGTGSLRLTQDGVAAHLADIPRAQESLEASATAEELAIARGTADGELALRLERRDPRQFQAVAAGSSAPSEVDVLVPLNVIWDTAALDRARLFPSCTEWLRAILEWAVRHPEVSVCIRQHPRERVHQWKTSDDPAALVASYAASAPRVRFLASAEPVSTYDLLRAAKVVLPHTSTVGVEAVMLGKPVILATHCYYEDMGFAQQPPTPGAYFAAVEEALGGDSAPGEAERDRARLNYYLTQRCAWISTVFTAIPEDYRQWVELDPVTLWSRPELFDLGTAILQGEMLPLVRHRRLAQEVAA